MLLGTSRPEFFSLAPNSITKVRVYVYLEGQDVDNYDFASLGSQIKINFGFTKERFDQDEIIVEENSYGRIAFSCYFPASVYIYTIVILF